MAINSPKHLSGNPGVISTPVIKSPSEVWTVSATAASGTINFDVKTQAVLYYTTAATASFTLNFRGDATSTLSSMLDVGKAITVVFINTNGTTPYYASAFQVDGVAVTPKWVNGAAPLGGTASSSDAYTLTIVKTASTPTYTLIGSLVTYS